MTKKILTLCLIHNDTHVLLGLKKRGFGEGRWNGFGGKLNEGETIEQAAMREVMEEASVEPEDLKKRGVINFEFQGDPEILEVHLFSATKFKGEPMESEEMKPQWFSRDKIPFNKMWPDDEHWFPLFLAGKNFNAHFLFKDQDTILEHEIKEI